MATPIRNPWMGAGPRRRVTTTGSLTARAVFVANPDAPIAAVAKHAGVGISAL